MNTHTYIYMCMHIYLYIHIYIYMYVYSLRRFCQVTYRKETHLYRHFFGHSRTLSKQSLALRVKTPNPLVIDIPHIRGPVSWGSIFLNRGWGVLSALGGRGFIVSTGSTGSWPPKSLLRAHEIPSQIFLGWPTQRLQYTSFLVMICVLLRGLKYTTRKGTAFELLGSVLDFVAIRRPALVPSPSAARRGRGIGARDPSQNCHLLRNSFFFCYKITMHKEPIKTFFLFEV